VCVRPGVSVSMSVCVCPGVSASMAGFLTAENLCNADVTESIVAREMRAAEQKQQAFKTSHQSHGRCSTQYRCGGGHFVLPCRCWHGSPCPSSA